MQDLPYAMQAAEVLSALRVPELCAANGSQWACVPFSSSRDDIEASELPV